MAAESDTSTRPKAEASDPSEVTIDELGREFDLPASTVRLYQNRRLLAPPIKRGRVGFYNDEHRSRLRMIAALQDRGFSLAAIKATLDSWDNGSSLAELLGTDQAVPSIGNAAERVRLTPELLLEHFGQGGVTQEEILRASELGMIEVADDGELTMPPLFLEAGASLREMGLSPKVILDEYEALDANVATIAKRFEDVFEAHLWQPFEADGMPEDGLVALAGDVDKLVGLAEKLVLLALRRHVAGIADTRLAQARAGASGG